MMESEVRDEVCDFDNLYRAMQHCKNNVMWKDSVAGYVKNGLVNVHKLKESVENGTYKLDAYTQFKVYEPKERDIVSTRIKDRVFQRSLCDNYFYDTMTKSFIYDNCACQDGRGTEFARKRLICHLQKYYRKHGTEGWALKADLKNFFGSTSHELAYSAVTKRVNDEWVNGEIKRIIDSFNQGDDPEVGMGLGSETTQLIQLAVLDDFDHFIKEQLRIKHYVRYKEMMKDGICTAIGVVGSVIASLFGGWDAALVTLVIFMAIDYVTGLLVAGVFHNSGKTENGALESRAGWKGLCRKCITLLMVLVATRLDLVTGTNFIRDAVVIAFIANETISIVENAGLMGINIPPAITSAIEVLKKKSDSEDNTDQ